MDYYQIINFSHQADLSFYDIQFTLPCEEIKVFRVLFLHFSCASTDSFQRMAEIIGESGKDRHGHIVTFYDTAWDDIPADKRNGKSVFDKLFPQKLLSRANYLRFFEGLSAVIENYICDVKPEIIFLTPIRRRTKKRTIGLFFAQKANGCYQRIHMEEAIMLLKQSITKRQTQKDFERNRADKLKTLEICFKLIEKYQKTA